jgi:hypothetical protein
MRPTGRFTADDMVIDILLGIGIIAVAAYMVWLRGAIYRALGLRDDWKRRFDQLKKVLGL